MNHKALDFVALWSVLMQALSVLGVVVLTFGSWKGPSVTTARTTLILSGFAFWMISMIASNARTLLVDHADRIAALERELSARRPGPLSW